MSTTLTAPGEILRLGYRPIYEGSPDKAYFVQWTARDEHRSYLLDHSHRDSYEEARAELVDFVNKLWAAAHESPDEV